MTAPSHLNWLVNTGNTIATADGHTVELWELQHADDPAVLSAWAKHFREHYCRDEMLEQLIEGTGLTKAEYLRDIKFPDVEEKPGPSIRVGDFAEIIVADYLEYKLGYWCPRQFRYDAKMNRNESSKGCDVIGFKLVKEGSQSPKDELFVFESKALATGKPKMRLQSAIDDSHKDKFREATTLNAMKQRFVERRENASANKVARFQNEADKPFTRISGAAAVHDAATFDSTITSTAVTAKHFNAPNLKLIVVTAAA
jgi:hypothetical protein